MTVAAAILPIIQTTIQGIVQYKVATETKKIAIKTARVYVQGVRAARLAALALCAAGALAIFNIFAILLVTHAAYIVYNGGPDFQWTSWVKGEVILGSCVFLLDIGVILLVSSQRLWMKLFKVPLILDGLLNLTQGSNR